MCPHTGLNTSDSIPSSSYFGPVFEPTFEPYLYADDFLQAQHLEQQVVHLRYLNAELEDEASIREEEIDALYAWIKRAKRLNGQNYRQDSIPQHPTSSQIPAPSSSMRSNPPTKRERNGGHNGDKVQVNRPHDQDPGFHQIQIKLALLGFQAQIDGLAAQIAALQERFVLLGGDFSEYDGEDDGGSGVGATEAGGCGLRAGVQLPGGVWSPADFSLRGGNGNGKDVGWHLVEKEKSRGVMGSGSQDELVGCNEDQGYRSGDSDAEDGPEEERVAGGEGATAQELLLFSTAWEDAVLTSTTTINTS
ncbi:hypothetical protein IAQ61_005431 [Plenodomus lingam]|uniref:uncharacterized protein n=1 Tax=Leptosphaeria maculans TaxID=5022 RepID=UPI003316DA00|nr:hypothetical protein IAQ61_005431 [Plenodomus lingam]